MPGYTSIGDIVDNHYASYHETSPDGLGGQDELAICDYKKCKAWSKGISLKADGLCGQSRSD